MARTPLSPEQRQVREQEKRQRFEELASKRTTKVLQALSGLGNCGNRSSYSYTQEDVEAIFSAIEKAVNETEAKFAPSSGDGRPQGPQFIVPGANQSVLAPRERKQNGKGQATPKPQTAAQK